MSIASFSFALLIVLSIGNAFAQKESDSPIPFAFSPKPTNCETNHVRLDAYAKLFSASASNKSLIIVIARLGVGEHSAALNRSRLYVVRATLVGDLKLRDQDVVTAVGERVNGYGRVEIYLNGKLIDTLLVKRGKSLCADCCYPEGREYSYPIQKKKQY